MDTELDIFERLANGSRFWITSVTGIDQARARINRLKAIAPGEYLIYSERSIKRARGTAHSKRRRRAPPLRQRETASGQARLTSSIDSRRADRSAHYSTARRR